ncbi:hypothetical protein WN55_11418, partial [Dufourea novaeangliae]
WSSARVEVLAARPLRSFRCLEEGHVRQNCPSDADRGGRCYSCGGTGHVARDCAEAPRCPVCADLGVRIGPTAVEPGVRLGAARAPPPRCACRVLRRRHARHRAGGGRNQGQPSGRGGGGHVGQRDPGVGAASSNFSCSTSLNMLELHSLYADPPLNTGYRHSA